MDGAPLIPERVLPLEGVRVLAVEQYGAGPWATLQLADMGAEVIKIEDPAMQGDVGRYIPPYQKGNTSLFFETFNRNKKSIVLDLKSAGGRRVFEKLVTVSDIVFSNLRGDVPEQLALTYAHLAPHNPRIVCCSLSGFGMTGPRAREAGYDYLMQGLAGWMSLTGEPSSPPTKSGLSLVDLSAGYVATVAMLAALRKAESTGLGADCDISLFETALAQLMYIATWVATEAYEPVRVANSAHPSIVPFQSFRTSDGWIVVACPKEKFWQRLCAAMDLSHLTTEQRYSDLRGRLQNRAGLLEVLEDAFARRTTSEWIELLLAAGVPCSPVNNVEAALADPQSIARGVVIEIEHPVFGTIKQIASPLRFVGQEPTYVRGPHLGEHTEEVLIGIAGLSRDELSTLTDTRRT